jgi:HSP20 family protein
MDVIDQGGEYEIRASLPGVRPEDIDITATGNTITIRAQRKEEMEERRENYLLRERRAGGFSRTITLPEEVNVDQIQASTENGVLMVRVPKSEQAKPKRIQVQAGGGARQVPAGGQGQQM